MEVTTDIESDEQRPSKKQHCACAANGLSLSLASPERFAALFSLPEKYADFCSITEDALFQSSELAASVDAPTMAVRVKELTSREVDEDHIYAALVNRKLALNALPSVTDVKVQDSMLQLLRVLTKRKLAVLAGRRMPPLDSVFSK